MASSLGTLLSIHKRRFRKACHTLIYFCVKVLRGYQDILLSSELP
jgi:hypothetical protein